MDDAPPVAVSLLVEFDLDEDEIDTGCDPFEFVDSHFCSLGCLAAWAMREALENNESEE